MAQVEERLERMLVMVPWIVQNDGPTIAEVARRFSTTEKQIVKDLEGVLFFCGVHPFSPTETVEVDISDGRVWIRLADYFSRPLRLTPSEGLGLLGAARFASARASDPVLARAIAKLSAVLNVDPDEVLEIEIGDADALILGTMEEAAAGHQLVNLDYYSYGRDAWERRAVEPHRVFNSNGAWYAWAWCRKVSDWRLFRIDRIRSAESTGEHFEPREAPPTPQPFAGSSGEEVVLELSPAARWASEEYPVQSVRAGRDGWTRVTLRVGEQAWLERLLLRLGPDARMVKGDAEAGRRAAERVLARYRQVTP